MKRLLNSWLITFLKITQSSMIILSLLAPYNNTVTSIQTVESDKPLTKDTELPQDIDKFIEKHCKFKSQGKLWNIYGNKNCGSTWYDRQYICWQVSQILQIGRTSFNSFLSLKLNSVFTTNIFICVCQWLHLVNMSTFLKDQMIILKICHDLFQHVGGNELFSKS